MAIQASLPMIDCRVPPGSVGQMNTAAVNEPRAANAGVSMTVAHEPGWIGWKWPSWTPLAGWSITPPLPSRSRRVVIAVDQPNEVELDGQSIVHGDAEAEPLARPHRLAGGVADDCHGTAGSPTSPRSTKAGEEDGVLGVGRLS